MEPMNLPHDSSERMASLLSKGLDARRSRRRTRAILAGAAGAVLAVGGTAGAAVVMMANQQQQTRTAYCYSAADTDSQYTQVGLADQTYGPDGTTSVEPSGSDRAAFAVDLCEATWRAGILPADYGQLPDLVACLREDGVPAVFPVPGDGSPDDVCEMVGLAALAS